MLDRPEGNSKMAHDERAQTKREPCTKTNGTRSEKKQARNNNAFATDQIGRWGCGGGRVWVGKEGPKPLGRVLKPVDV